MNSSHLEQAMQIVENRRHRNIAENEAHFQEIATEIPEVAEINQQLFQTGQELLRLIQRGENVPEKVETLKNQNLQGQQMVRNALQAHGYPTDYLDMHYTCEKCKDTGIVDDTYCTCVIELYEKLAAQELDQSIYFQDYTFDSFSLDYYKGQTYTGRNGNIQDCYASMKVVLESCQTYAERFSMNSPSILMYGNTGLGKTHLSLAIAHNVLQKGYTVLYDSTINFMQHIEKEHFKENEENTDTLQTVLDCDLLVMDDLGTEMTTKFTQSILYTIINTRMNQKKPTIISTNLNPVQIKNRYEERIASRILYTYRVFLFAGKDVRELKLQQKNNMARN